MSRYPVWVSDQSQTKDQKRTPEEDNGRGFRNSRLAGELRGENIELLQVNARQKRRIKSLELLEGRRDVGRGEAQRHDVGDFFGRKTVGDEIVFKVRYVSGRGGDLGQTRRQPCIA